MCNVSRSKKAKYKMAGIDNSYNPYALVALKTITNTPRVDPVEGESDDTTKAVDNKSVDKVTISSSSRQEPTNAERLTELLLSHKTVSNVDLNENLHSDDPEISQNATEQYQALRHLFNHPSNIRNQYAAFDQVYKDADGFIYIAGRGLEPYSNDGGKYPTQEALQKDADEALKQYLSVSSPISAQNKLSQIGATGKEPTPEEQVEIAELLKQEVESGSLSKDEIKNIKSKLRDAYIGLIPDEAPETQSLRKVVGGLVRDLDELSTRNDSTNQAWFKAVNLNLTFKDEETSASSLSEQAKELQEIRTAGKSIIYTDEQARYWEEEPALT
jgi:hypothetical protein